MVLVAEEVMKIVKTWLMMIALVFGAVFLMPLSAPAITTQPASSLTTVAHGVIAYDAGTVRVVSGNTLTGAGVCGLSVPTFDPSARLVAAKGTAIVKYDAAFARSQILGGGKGKASDIVRWAEGQGWTRTRSPGGPIKYVDQNGIVRATIKQGSPRTPGSEIPHVELRAATGQRIDPYGNPVTKPSPGNHTPIEWDLE
jgi:hypothetical protein